jgi:lipopolysaccharide export system permease protein
MVPFISPEDGSGDATADEQSSGGQPPQAEQPQSAVPTASALAQSEADARVEVLRTEYSQAKKQRAMWLVEIHKKFSLAAACIVFAFVGAPIALRFPRGGAGLVLGVSFLIFGAYYVCLIGGESLADHGVLEPWISMWLANGIFMAAGVVLYARVGRETATSRSGGVSELLSSIGSAFRRSRVAAPAGSRRRTA